MHSNDRSSERNSEVRTTEHGYVRESVFVGDSMTSESIDALRDEFDQRFDRLERRLEHLARHDRRFPTEGCEFCGVPGAA